MNKTEKALLAIGIALGIALRFTDVGWVDVNSDEGQFLTGEPHAQPMLAISIMQWAMAAFGYSHLVARWTTGVFSVLTIGMVWLTTREMAQPRAALYAALVASLVPSHIFFARIGYLDTYMMFGWLLILWSYLRMRTHPSSGTYLVYFFITCITLFFKTQGFIFPLFLLLHRLWEKRGRIAWDLPFWLTGLSMVPIAGYILTHPDIILTSLHASNTSIFGLSARRAFVVLTSWARYSGIFMLIVYLSALAYALRKRASVPVAVFLLILTVFVIQFYFGADHKYYTTYLIAFAFLVGPSIAQLRPWMRISIVCVLMVHTLTQVSPISWGLSPRIPLYFTSYWNLHEEAINEQLRSHAITQVILLPDAGHQLRWYIDAEILAGTKMPDAHTQNNVFLIQLTRNPIAPPEGTILYDDGVTRLVDARQ